MYCMSMLLAQASKMAGLYVYNHLFSFCYFYVEYHTDVRKLACKHFFYSFYNTMKLQFFTLGGNPNLQIFLNPVLDLS